MQSQQFTRTELEDDLEELFRYFQNERNVVSVDNMRRVLMTLGGEVYQTVLYKLIRYYQKNDIVELDLSKFKELMTIKLNEAKEKDQN